MQSGQKSNTAFLGGESGAQLSLARCREILGTDRPESDAELLRLREQLYSLARVLVEAFSRSRRKNDPPCALNGQGQDFASNTAEMPQAGFPAALAALPEEERYLVEERAGMLEDNGLERNASEQAAFSEYWREKHRKK